MPLTLQQLKALDALVRTGLDVSESARRAWFDALPVGDDGVKALLEKALFPERGVESGTFLAAPSGLFFEGRDAGDDADDAERSDLAVGQHIGAYTLDELLGEGGSASVWRAHRSDRGLKRSVALKLPYFVGNTRGWHDRVLLERDILASLQHPNVANIFDAGVEANGRPWLALELIDGERIDTHCKRTNATLAQRVSLVQQIARTVEYAHARGVIHRDLKPANILVDQRGQVKLLDFGIAKLLATNDASGTTGALTELHGRPFTPDYASPEQRAGAAITTGTDVYALGVVLYELLAGVRPAIRSVSAGQDARARAPSRAAKRDSTNGVNEPIRPDLDAICLKALHPDPLQRYATASAFADDLDRYTRNEPVSAQPDSQRYRVAQFLRRNKLAVSAAGAVALSLVGGVGVASWQAREANTQRGIAETQAANALAASDDALRAKRAAEESSKRAETSALLAQRESERSAQAAQLAAAETARARASEAGRLLEAVAAKREADKATAVKDFLVRMFETSKSDQTDAQAKQNSTLAQFLVEAETKLRDAFPDQPLIKEEMLGVVGELHEELGMLDSALRLRKQLVDLRHRRNAPADERAEALVRLATVYTTQDDAKNASDALAKAKSGLRGQTSAAAQGVLGEVLAQEAYSQSWTPDAKPDEVKVKAAEAIALLEKHRPKSSLVVVAYASLARSERIRRNFVAETAAWRDAVRVSERQHGSRSLSVADTRIELSQSLFQQQRYVEAKTEADTARAVVLETAGPTTVSAANAHLWAGRLAGYTGDYAQSVALIRQGIKVHEASPKPVLGNLEAGYAFLVEALLARGAIAEAAQPAMSMVKRVLPTPVDDRKNRAGNQLYWYGQYLVQVGKYDEAVSMFERVLALRIRPGFPDADSTKFLRIALAHARVRSGDYATGLTEISALANDYSEAAATTSAAFRSKWMLALLDSEARTSDRFSTLTTMFKRAEAETTTVAGMAQSRRVVTDLQRALAELAVEPANAGVSASALGHARDLVRSSETTLAPNAPQLAHDRLLLAVLLATHGDRKAASELAAKARTALAQTPEAAPHFRKLLPAFEARADR